MLNSTDEFVKLLGLWGKGMSVPLRKSPFCCWQRVLRTHTSLHLVARGLRQPLPATLPSISAERCPALGTKLGTDGQVAVLTSRNHVGEKDKGPEVHECLEQPVSLHLNESLPLLNCLSGFLAPFLGKTGQPSQAGSGYRPGLHVRDMKLCRPGGRHALPTQPSAACPRPSSVFGAAAHISFLLFKQVVSFTEKASQNPS